MKNPSQIADKDRPNYEFHNNVDTCTWPEEQLKETDGLCSGKYNDEVLDIEMSTPDLEAPGPSSEVICLKLI